LAGAGAWLGFEGLPSTVLVASLLALGTALLPLLKGARLDPRMRISFGPYLALAIWTVWHWGPII
jgi:leader peptidase (prepilin peptidase)/N-methyltransferase